MFGLGFLAPFFLPVLGWAKGIGSTFGRILANPKALLALAGVVVVALLFLQSARLSHAKADLKAARAALVDPATHRKWQDEAASAARDLATCRANASTLTAAINRQNAALAAVEAEGTRRVAAAEKAASDARGAAAAAEKARVKISAPLKPDTACAKAAEVDRRFLESLP